MVSDRILLKYELRERYGLPTRRGKKPLCGVCRLTIDTEPDMHEAIITRGEWASLPPELIMVEENCVLVHPGGKTGGCHSVAHTREGRLRMVQVLIDYHGEEKIVAWLESLREHVRSGLVDEKLRLVREVARGRQGNDVGERRAHIDTRASAGAQL